jgi:transposase
MSKLLVFQEATNYYLYRKPVKMSRSFDGLAALIRTEMGKDIISGDVFIFLNRSRSTLKIFVYEGKGFSIYYRRLDEGSFQLPLISSDHLSYKMSVEQMMYMLSGMALEEDGYVKAAKYEPLHGSHM